MSEILPGEIVDDGELFGQQKQNVGNVRELRRGRARRIGEPRLDVTDGVVAEIAGETAAEPRQARTERRAIAAQELADERERVALVPLDDAAAVLDFDLPAARSNPDLGRQTDKRIAAEALAADDRLQQVGEALVGELEIERERGVEVRERARERAGCGYTLALRARGIRLRS